MSEDSVIPQPNDDYQKVEVFLLLLDEKSWRFLSLFK